jgi:hypothetical protein
MGTTTVWKAVALNRLAALEPRAGGKSNGDADLAVLHALC